MLESIWTEIFGCHKSITYNTGETNFCRGESIVYINFDMLPVLFDSTELE
jgi:hypothetical protein